MTVSYYLTNKLFTVEKLELFYKFNRLLYMYSYYNIETKRKKFEWNVLIILTNNNNYFFNSMFILIVGTLHEYWFFLYVDFTRLFFVKVEFKLPFKNLF